MSTRSLNSRLGQNRVLLTQDPTSTVVPVLEPSLIQSPSGMIIDQSPPEPQAIILEETVLGDGFKHTERDVDLNDLEETEVDEYLAKIRNFDADFNNDIYLPIEQKELLINTISKLERVQNYVGHGNFNLIGFDEMLFFARNY